jgi:hypothetical protein
MGTVCKAFAKPALFVDESANVECCSYIRYDSNFIYHNIHNAHGGKTLTQPIITDSKIQHANSFCVYRKSHFDPPGKRFLETNQTFLFVQLL